MYIYEVIFSQLKLAVFGDCGYDCGDFFALDKHAEEKDCYVYIALGDVMDWNTKVFGRVEGKYLHRGLSEALEADQEYIDKWVDSFLRDIAVWCYCDVCEYLERLYNKRQTTLHIGWIDFKPFENDIYASLDGEIGREIITLNRYSDSLYIQLSNYDWVDNYILDTDEDGIVSNEAIEVLKSKFRSLEYSDKVAKLFLDGTEPLRRNSCLVTDLGNGVYRVEFSYYNVFKLDNDSLEWLETICKKNDYGGIEVEGTYEELENMVRLVKE